MLMKRQGLAAGYGDCSLVDWKDSSEGAEKTVVGRRFHSETAGEGGVGSVPSSF